MIAFYGHLSGQTMWKTGCGGGTVGRAVPFDTGGRLY